MKHALAITKAFTAAVLLVSSADGPVHRIQSQEVGKIHCLQAAAEIVAAESALAAAVLAGVVVEAASVPFQFGKTQVVEGQHYIHMASPPSSYLQIELPDLQGDLLDAKVVVEVEVEETVLVSGLAGIQIACLRMGQEEC